LKYEGGGGDGGSHGGDDCAGESEPVSESEPVTPCSATSQTQGLYRPRTVLFLPVLSV